MKKVLKIIFGVLGLVIGLVIVAAIVLPLVIDPNDYKDEITRKVAEQTGRTLAIEGDIDLSVFPWLGLDIGPTQLSNAQGFGDQPMARMQAVQVRVKLLPLLRKQLEMDTVKLSGLQLNLAKDKQGRTNWADLQGAADAEEKPAAEEERAGTGCMLEGLAISGIEVSDARLIWDDRASNAHYEVNDLAFKTGAIRPAAPFDLDLQFRVTSGEPAMQTAFDLSGAVLLGESLQTVAVNKAALQLDLQGAAVPGGEMRVSLATDVALDLEKQTLTLPELVLKLAGLTITGNVAGTAITGDDPRFSGALRIAEFVPRDVLKALGQAAPETADGSVLGKADALVNWEASTKHAAATTLQVRLDDTKLEGQASVRQFDAPAIAFSLQVDQIDLDRYLPPVPKDPDAQKPAAESGESGELPLEALRGLNLDGTVKVGNLKAYNLRSTDVNMRIKANNGVLRINPAGARMYDGQYRGDITVDASRDTARIALDEHITGVRAGPLLKDLTGKEQLLGTAELHAQL
ncbi:MAG: AsmA family protein, partial [Gammaproteobacteria bacterium]